jgi:hypothetical protein
MTKWLHRLVAAVTKWSYRLFTARLVRTLGTYAAIELFEEGLMLTRNDGILPTRMQAIDRLRAQLRQMRGRS